MAADWQSPGYHMRRRQALDVIWHREHKRCFWCDIVTQKYTRKRSKFANGLRHPSDLATIDHIVTQASRGGDNIENLVLACERCNGERGNSDFVAYGIAVIVRKLYGNRRDAA